MGKVVVLGSINRDLVVNVPRFPQPGETLAGHAVAMFPGGKGANQAVAARRMGADVRLAGALGRDGNGEAMAAFLAGEGIDLSAVIWRDDAPTGLATIFVDDRAENLVVVVAGANATLSEEDARALPVASGDIVLSQFEVPMPAILAAFAAARAKGAFTVLNPAPIAPIPAELAALCDLVILNETELAGAVPEALRNAAIPVQAEAFAAATGGQVVVTLGAEGCLAIAGGREFRLPGRRVAAIDTTGAGDCFVGTCVAGLAAGLPLETALMRANDAAAISVTRAGAAASMPTASELG